MYYYLSWPFPLGILLKIQGRKTQDILKEVSKAARSNLWYIFLSGETKGFLNFSDIPSSLCVCVCACVCACVCVFSCVRIFATPWTVAFQAPLFMGSFWQEYWNGLPFPSLGVLPDPGIKPASPALAGIFFTTEPLGSLSLRFFKYRISGYNFYCSSALPTTKMF